MKRSKELSAVATLIVIGVVVYSFMILMTTDTFVFDVFVGLFVWLFSLNIMYLLSGCAITVVGIYLVIYHRMRRV